MPHPSFKYLFEYIISLVYADLTNLSKIYSNVLLNKYIHSVKIKFVTTIRRFLMVKKLFLITFILFMVSVNYAFGHTGLESSSPQAGEVIEAETNEIKMTFETKIEQGSTFELTNANGNAISIENINLSNNQMVGSLSNNLANGDYKVNWKIIGADGHPIEGEFSFTVNAPTVVDPTEKNEDGSQKNAEEAKEDLESLNEEEAQTEQEQTKTKTNWIPSLIGVLIIAVIGSFLWIMRKGK